MIRSLKALCCAGAFVLVGCNLLQTNDSENNLAGAGSQHFNPYGSVGAIRMSLQDYNGCAMGPNALPFGKGNASIPYPASCFSYDPEGYRLDKPFDATSSAPMPVLTGTDYFLGQLTLVNRALSGGPQSYGPFPYDGPFGLEDTLDWIKNKSMFTSLDWSNLSQLWDDNEWDYIPDPNPPRARTVMFTGANWMIRHNDVNQDWQFKVEVLDANGSVVSGPVVYNRADFLAENPMSKHTQVMLEQYNVTAPKFPGDTDLQPGLPDWTRFDMAMIRIDLEGSTNPFKTFDIPRGLSGDGSIRVTWSLMPNRPFYWPVTFVAGGQSNGNAVVPGSTCYFDDGGTTPCSFGLNPTVELSTPANGTFYKPGESFDVKFAFKDSAGHLLHPPDQFPSWAEYKQSVGVAGELQTNGIGPGDQLELWYGDTEHLDEVKIVGPLQNLRPVYSVLGNTAGTAGGGKPFFSWPFPQNLGLTTFGYSVPGQDNVRLPPRKTVDLPSDAQPGTYVALIKGTRQFMGERVSKTNSFFFQVGQEAETHYPGRVGNCQICHRGVISLDNLLHGLSVNNVEACKACHTFPDNPYITSTIPRLVHRIHMSSDKFPLLKRQCTTCHLTRESATRPSIEVCGACHESIHGGAFFSLEYSTDPTNNRFSNCAQACHATSTLPSQHILPAN